MDTPRLVMKPFASYMLSHGSGQAVEEIMVVPFCSAKQELSSGVCEKLHYACFGA